MINNRRFWGITTGIATLFGALYIIFSANLYSLSAGTAGPQAVGTRPGQIAPQFITDTIDGETVSLTEFRGKPVVLNFWASWCGPCRVETPHFQRFSEEMGDAITVIGVNQQERPEKIEPFIDEFGVTYPIWLDLNGRISQTYEIFGLPTTYILDQNGVIVAILPGGITEGALHDQIRPLLAEK